MAETVSTGLRDDGARRLVEPEPVALLRGDLEVERRQAPGAGGADGQRLAPVGHLGPADLGALLDGQLDRLGERDGGRVLGLDGRGEDEGGENGESHRSRSSRRPLTGGPARGCVEDRPAGPAHGPT